MVTGCLERWRDEFQSVSLAEDSAVRAADERRTGTDVGDALIKPIQRFAFSDGSFLVFFGDEFQAAERTHLLALCNRRGLRVLECGWDLEAFRALDFNQVCAVHCNISRSWEVKGERTFNHGWGAFTFQAWDDSIMLWRAGLCRLLCSVLRTMWRLLIQGRAIGLRLCSGTEEIVQSPPFQRLQTVGAWCSGSISHATWWASTHSDGALSLFEAWGLSSAYN